MARMKIVARFADGRILKGHADNLMLGPAGFHLFPLHDIPETRAIWLAFSDLKAVFVVHSFDGKPNYEERKAFGPRESPVGAKLKITFHDGETMVGKSNNFDPNATGFFLLPVDAHSNNQRILVFNHAIKHIKRVA